MQRHAGPDAFAPLPEHDPRHYSRLDLPRGDLWIFTYGSLMWDPAFRYAERVPALLRGYPRSFCIYSSRYRGTASKPGLVLGLDRGGACRGIAYRISEHEVPRSLEQLWLREMRRGVYVPRLLPVAAGEERRAALTFLANRTHDGYAGRLELENCATIIAECRGERGPNVDYLVNTLRHLDALGVRDQRLHRLLAKVRARAG